jgi:cobalt-zinc-cadmium efflux system membrane fusion protein
LALALGLFCVGFPAAVWAGDVPAGGAAAPAETQPPEVTLAVAAQQNAGLETGHAQAGVLTGTIDAMATVQPEASHLVRIHPAGVGKVLAVSVVPGQHVSAGDVLLIYQNYALHGVRLQITKAQAALSTAQAALQNARATYERGRALEGGAVSVGETRRRFAALRAAQGDVQGRQVDLDTLRHRLEHEYNSVTESDVSPSGGDDEISRIIAPSVAEVQTVGVGVADDIGPNTELVTLADLSTVWIVSDILPQDAQRVQPGGEQVTVPERQGGPVLRSTITSIGYLVDPATGLVRVISRADNAKGRLHPGMFLTTRLPTRDPVSGVLVPAGAVVDIDGVSTVFVPKGPERFQARSVHVGAEQDGKAVIVSGLAAGEAVVTQGAFTLKSVMLKSSTGGD